MVQWKAGAPDKPGIYWFDNGLRIFKNDPPGYLIVRSVLCKDDTLSSMSYGHGGGGPLSSIYSPKHCLKARYANIAIPNENANWKDKISSKEKYAWVKDEDGYIGFALLKGAWGSDNSLSASVLYIDHPNYGSYHGKRLKMGECRFIAVKKPK